MVVTGPIVVVLEDIPPAHDAQSQIDRVRGVKGREDAGVRVGGSNHVFKCSRVEIGVFARIDFTAHEGVELAEADVDPFVGQEAGDVNLQIELG